MVGMSEAATDGETESSETGRTESEDGSTYSGLVSAFPYAVRKSNSWLFRSYALLGGLLSLGLVLLFVLALVVVIAATTAGAGGTFSLSRAFFVLVGLSVVAPLLAPVLFVARHHRREGADRRYDAALALAGYLFAASLYVGVIITVPAEQQATPTSTLTPVVEFLYGLPALAGLLPPALAAVGIYLVHRFAR
jgi:cytochrome c biogenesis factor